MTQTAQSGMWGFGMQSAKGTLATSWYRHMASQIDFGPVQDMKNFPLEVGGAIIPTGQYKGGAFVAGGATIQPRLQGDLGWLFKATMGQVVTTPGAISAAGIHAAIDAVVVANTTTGFTVPPSARRILFTPTGFTGTVTFTISGTDDSDAVITEAGFTLTVAGGVKLSVKEYKTVTGINVTSAATGSGSFTTGFYQSNSHVAKFNTLTDDIPWISVRKLLPPNDATNGLGEIGKDCRLNGLRINAPQNGIISARVDVTGREPVWEEGATLTSWTWLGGLEDYKSVPLSCVANGYIKLPNYSASALPILNLTWTFANNTTSPQQEMIIGSPFPDDFAVLSRSLTLQATLKWNDKALYKKLMMGSGTVWDPAPFETDLDVKLLAPKNVPTTAGTIPYSLQMLASAVTWTPQSSPQLEGGGFLSLQLQGQAVLPATGDYASLTWVNEYAAY